MRKLSRKAGLTEMKKAGKQRLFIAAPYHMLYEVIETNKIYIIKIGIDQVKYLPKRAITPEDCIFINHCLETQLKEKFKREGVR